MLNAAEIRKDFPILATEMAGKPLVYLDNAATSQKPRQVIDAIVHYYETTNANVHRAIHDLGERATELYEGAREKVARFIGSPTAEQVAFVRNASEALNLIAYAYVRKVLKPGDIIVANPMEHHSDLIPWQQAALQTGATLRFIQLTEDGRLDLGSYFRLLDTGRVKIVAVTHASNVLGTINPIAEMARDAHRAGARIVVDGAQSTPHMPVDVRALDVDFFAFSGHKMLGPTGSGAWYGKRELLEEMNPFLFGGSMISEVHLEEAAWAPPPAKFEAGTPDIAGAIGLGAAVDYLGALGMENVRQHEIELADYAWEKMHQVPGIAIYGPRRPRTGLITFNLDDVHPHDVSTVLNSEGIAIRGGHHCAQPLMEWLEVPATNRASFYIYNTEAEVDQLCAALVKTREFFHVAQ